MAENPELVTAFVMRRGLTASEVEEWNDLFEAQEHESRRLQRCLTTAEFSIACGHASHADTRLLKLITLTLRP